MAWRGHHQTSNEVSNEGTTYASSWPSRTRSSRVLDDGDFTRRRYLDDDRHVDFAAGATRYFARWLTT